MNEGLTPTQLVQMVRDDRVRKWSQGQRILAEAYLERYPAIRADPAQVLELVYHEVMLREELGEAPQLEEYMRRFPELSPQLGPLFEVHRALEDDMLSTLKSKDSGLSVAVDAPSAIAGYEIVGTLGRGGMGVVFLARQTSLKRLVALKTIAAKARARAADLVRFRAEAESQARLQHPNIVQVFEVGEVGGDPYFALEYVDGGSLDKLLARKPQPARKAARLLETLARAIHYAHQCGLVHRDLKPANVLLTADGTPKISDFGLAKRLEEETGLTQSGDILGTAAYMAPEQASGHARTVGPAAAVYALGVILYEMLTGRPPFLAETALDTLVQLRTLDPLPPRRLQPKTPRDLETICLKCLQKEPAKRYANAEDLAEDLRRFQAGETIVARPLSRMSRVARWCRRNPALAAVSGLAVAAVLGVIVVLGFLGVQQRQALRESQREIMTRSFEQGLLLAEQGEAALGFLRLAHSLQQAPPGTEEMQRVIRTNLGGWHRHLHALTGCHEQANEVRAIACSPDGRTVVIACGNQALLLDAQTGDPIRYFRGHKGLVWAVAVSPDGKKAVTGSGDHTVRVWDVNSARCLHVLRGSDDPVRAVAISPDGRTIVAGGSGTTATLWDIETEKELRVFKGHQGKVMAAAFHPRDSQKVATGSRDFSARLWDVDTPEAVRVVGKTGSYRHEHLILAVAYSPDGRRLLTASQDGTARVWDLTRNQAPPIILRHHDFLASAAFSPDGRWIITGSHDRTVQLWNARTGQPFGSPMYHGGLVHAVAFSPDSTAILTGGQDRCLRTWRVAGQEVGDEGIDVKAWVTSLTWSSDGKMLFVAGRPKRVLCWDAVKWVGLGRRFAHDQTVHALAISPDGKLVATACEDGVARIWDADADRIVGQPLSHQQGTARTAVLAVVFHPDGRTVLTGSVDHTARVWDVATGKEQRRLNLKGPVNAVAISPDGRLLLTGSGIRGKGQIQPWDAATGEAQGDPFAHDGVVMSVAFRPDGRLVVAGGVDGVVRLWDIAARTPRGKPVVHGGSVRAVAFSPNGRTFLTGSSDGTARLWDVETGKPLGPPLRHQGAVLAAAFHPSGLTFVSGGADHWVRHASTPAAVSGDPLRLLRWTEVVTGMELDADGTVHSLDAATWNQRREELAALGGPPNGAEAASER